MRSITEIIIHCSATRPNWMDGKDTSEKVAEIRRWHTDPKPKGRGWSDIGYHHLIDRDGTIAAGRPIEKIGAHTKGHNSRSIGVCLIGGHGSSENDSFNEHFTPQQDKALRDYISSQKEQFPTISKISGHNEYAAKACPGFNVANWFTSGLSQSLAELAAASPQPAFPVSAMTDPRFEKLHSFVRQWVSRSDSHSGGQAGSTNLGVNLEMLAAWRSPDVTTDDLMELSQAEANEVFRTQYYSACRCGEMPERMAMVVYNAATQFDPNFAVELAQTAFNSLGLTVDGEPLEVDGRIGRLTMAAIKKTDASVLAEAFLDTQETHMRGLISATDVGSDGMSRLAALREFVNTLPQGAGVRPNKKMSVSDSEIDLKDILEIAGAAKSGDTAGSLAKVAGLLLREDSDDSGSRARNKALARLVLGVNEGAPIPADVAASVTKGPDGNPPLTPINAALGQTIGKAMNGKKSVTGIVGLLITVILPKLGISGDVVNFLNTYGEPLISIFALITGWGLFGKIDKAIRLMGMINSRK